MPFRDFSSTHLTDATAEEAAKFAVQYAVGHIRSSATLYRLCQPSEIHSTSMDSAIQDLRVRACGEELRMDHFTTDQFIKDGASKQLWTADLLFGMLKNEERRRLGVNSSYKA